MIRTFSFILLLILTNCVSSEIKDDTSKSKRLVTDTTSFFTGNHALDAYQGFGFAWPSSLKVDTIIYLSTTESTLIGQVSKLIISEKSQNFILDRYQSKVFEFDETGQIIKVLDKHGGARHEFREVKDIQIDYLNNQILLLDGFNIKHYDLSTFDFIDNTSIPFKERDITRFIKTSDSTYYFWSDKPSPYFVSNLSVDHADYHHLIKMKGDSIDRYIKHEYGAISWNRFYPTHKKDQYNVDPFKGSNDIYRIDHDSVYLKYSFPFKDNSIPDFELKNTMEDFGGYLTNDYLKSINNIQETSTHLLFDFVGEQGIGYHVLFDKTAKEIVSIGKSSGIYIPVMATLDNHFFTVISAEDLFDLSEDGYHLEDDLILKHIDIKKVENSDNPIIIKYHL